MTPRPPRSKVRATASGTYQNDTTTPSQVTNQSVTITPKSDVVMIFIDARSWALISLSGSPSSMTGLITVKRNGSAFKVYDLGVNVTAFANLQIYGQMGAALIDDTVVPGTAYTYTVEAAAISANTRTEIQDMELTAIELPG